MNTQSKLADAMCQRRRHKDGNAHQRVLEWLLFGVGIVPWLGYWVRDTWDQTELGLGLLLMMPASRLLCTRLAARGGAS